MTVVLGLTPDSRRGDGIADLVAAAGDAGFSGLGLPAAQADASSAVALAEGGLHCHEILALMINHKEEVVLRKAQEVASAAAVVKAPWVLTAFPAPLDDVTAPIVQRAAAILAEAGTRMAVEFSPLGGVPSLPVALEVVEVAGADRAGVMIDTWHFFRGPSTWQDLESVPLDQIAYVQFADALEPASDDTMAETMNRRALPGDGVFDLGRFADTLLRRGWAGMVSVEVLSAGLRQLPVREFAARARESTARYWLH